MNTPSRVAQGLAVSLVAGAWIATAQCGTNSTGAYVGTGEDGGSSSGTGTSTGSSSSSSSSSSGGDSTGSSSGGSSTSSGGSSTGSSGGSGSTSSGSGSSGTGADGGTGSSSGSVPSPGQLFGTKNGNGESVVDSFFLFPCVEQDALNCKTDIPCPNPGSATWVDGQGLMNGNSQVGFQTHEYFQLGGTPGTTYLATIQVNGVSEGRGYVGGMRAAGNTVPSSTPPTGLDMFYTGGAPSKTGTDEDNYNIYEIVVWNPPANGTFQPPSPGYPGAAAPASMLGTKVHNYFLNSFPDENGADISKAFDTTYPVSFTHTIEVPGGGILEYAAEDQNCLAVDNCGLPGQANHNAPCGANGGIHIPNEPSLTSLPQTYMGTQVSSINIAGGASQPFHSQAFHIQVTKICVMGAAGCTPG